jgi:hypothetical protein
MVDLRIKLREASFSLMPLLTLQTNAVLSTLALAMRLTGVSHPARVPEMLGGAVQLLEACKRQEASNYLEDSSGVNCECCSSTIWSAAYMTETEVRNGMACCRGIAGV